MALSLRSKTGCLECRRRRAKCDETHPTCLRCRKIRHGCIWPRRSQITPQYLQTTKAIGNAYASLFLHHGFIDLLGYTPLRNADEHYRLIRLSAFLSSLTVKRPSAKDQEDSFEFAVALEVPWVRDAMLAFAGFVNKSRDHDTMWRNISPYYSSASSAVRINVLKELDEARLEQQSKKSLPATTSRFHRIATEAYLYHIAIQSLFWPQTDRYATLSSSQKASDHSLDARFEMNISMLTP